MFLTSFHLIQSEGGGSKLERGFCYFFAFLTAAFTKSGLTGGDDQISTYQELVKDVYLAHFHQSKRFISD